MGQLGPFWPNSNEAKGGSSEAPNHNWAHLSQLLTQNPNWPSISPWPLATIRGHQISSKQGFPSSSGEYFPLFNSLRTQGPGVVHIWYNIPS
ncbi:hypothetical protein O181_114207 [Austropuccinia psidii MF-1]|uniref:Uncharacterized protein n=1 Tax=Austropuccinia psidii MF-1 TaxID=1389203 RepID=A0A9Q3PW48_9BASI|nr:hypothetical protein [Austropuccinia psidii MF-1]